MWKQKVKFKSWPSQLNSLSTNVFKKGIIHKSISSTPNYGLHSREECALSPWLAASLREDNSEFETIKKAAGKHYYFPKEPWQFLDVKKKKHWREIFCLQRNSFQNNLREKIKIHVIYINMRGLQKKHSFKINISGYRGTGRLHLTSS